MYTERIVRYHAVLKEIPALVPLDLLKHDSCEGMINLTRRPPNFTGLRILMAGPCADESIYIFYG